MTSRGKTASPKNLFIPSLFIKNVGWLESHLTCCHTFQHDTNAYCSRLVYVPGSDLTLRCEEPRPVSTMDTRRFIPNATTLLSSWILVQWYYSPVIVVTLDPSLGCPSNWDILVSNIMPAEIVLFGPYRWPYWLIWVKIQRLLQ